MEDVLAEIEEILTSTAFIDEFVASYGGVTHAGVAVIHPETGKILLAKRAKDETDDDEVAETWEFPGGELEDGEDPQAGAFREFEEEIGVSLEGSEVVNGWGKGNYQGFVVVAGADLTTIHPDPDEVADVAWHTVDEAKARIEDGTLRPELHEFDWSLVEHSGMEDAVEENGTGEVALQADAEIEFSEEEWQEDFDLAPEEWDSYVPDDEEEATTAARGKGWATDPKETRRLHKYWTQKGQPGYAKIRWGQRGDFTRARKLIGEKIAKNSPDKMRYLNRIIAQWHHDALGYWPGELDKPGNKTSAEARAERKAKVASIEELHEQSAALNASAATFDWDAALTAAGTSLPKPPKEYFERHPDTTALTIEEPDENGIRRVHGYAGQWGVCHVGFEDRCVMLPKDPDGEFRDYQLGSTMTAEGERLKTGVITYAIGHREGAQILSETPEKAHFDDVSHAWAAVRLGEDEQGVWYSGYVLPHVPEEDLVLIQASGQVSGEWRGDRLRSLLAVNVPGFPVVRASAHFDEEGEVTSLVASYNSIVEDAPCSQSEDDEGDVIETIAAAVEARLEAKARLSAFDQWVARESLAQIEEEFI